MLSTHDTVFVDETRKGTISKVGRGRQASETKQFRIKRLKMKMACTLSISRRENKGIVDIGGQEVHRTGQWSLPQLRINYAS